MVADSDLIGALLAFSVAFDDSIPIRVTLSRCHRIYDSNA